MQSQKRRIHLAWTGGGVDAELSATPSADALWQKLPVQGRANLWGDELYFSIPLTLKREADAQQVVEPGTLCFWTDGDSIALPWGPTPISEGDECRLASACNVLGRITLPPDQLRAAMRTVHAGDNVVVSVA